MRGGEHTGPQRPGKPPSGRSPEDVDGGGPWHFCLGQQKSRQGFAVYRERLPTPVVSLPHY